MTQHQKMCCVLNNYSVMESNNCDSKHLSPAYDEGGQVGCLGRVVRVTGKLSLHERNHSNRTRQTHGAGRGS